MATEAAKGEARTEAVTAGDAQSKGDRRSTEAATAGDAQSKGDRRSTEAATEGDAQSKGDGSRDRSRYQPQPQPRKRRQVVVGTKNIHSETVATTASSSHGDKSDCSGIIYVTLVTASQAQRPRETARDHEKIRTRELFHCLNSNSLKRVWLS